MRIRVGLLTIVVLLMPSLASASLVTFDFTGTGAQTSVPFTAMFTVDTDNAGTAFPLCPDFNLCALAGTQFDIVEPGTGFSIDYNSQTYFAHSLTIFFFVGEYGAAAVVDLCPNESHMCDFLGLHSDLGDYRFSRVYDPDLGSAQDQDTLTALATESLTGFHNVNFGDGAILRLPGLQQNNLGTVTSIVRVSEPSTGLLMLLALLGLLLVFRSSKNLTGPPIHWTRLRTR